MGFLGYTRAKTKGGSVSIPSRIEIVMERTAEDDWWWVVTSPTVPGAITQGKTIEEACSMIGEALTLMLEDE